MQRSVRSASQPAARPEPAGGYAVALLAGSGLMVAALLFVAAMSGRSASPVTWYVARASGIMLYLVLWLSAIGGLGLTTALMDRAAGRGVVFSLHAFTTPLAYGFLALHLLSIAADPTVDFGLKALLVPFTSPWREPWTGFGVLAAELTVLVGASFSVKRVIGQRAWRALHWLTFPLYGLALLHGLGAGSDAGAPWLQALYLATGSLVVLFSTYRLFRRGSRMPAPARNPASAARATHAHPDHRGRRATGAGDGAGAAARAVQRRSGA